MPLRSTRFWFLVPSILAIGPLAHAQHVLYAENGDHFTLVRAALRNHPMVQDGANPDKLAHARGTRLALKSAPEYAPYFVDIRNLKIRNIADADLHISADFVSPYALNNVFLVLEMNTGQAGPTSLIWETGDLTAYRMESINLDLPMRSQIGEGYYQLYIFADGEEVFTSRMTPEYIDSKLDEMVAQRTLYVVYANPQQLTGPAPEYPKQFRGKHVPGKAVVQFTIGPTGRVHEPVVKSESDPAFGAAALAAIRQWRFLPKMVKGGGVASSAVIPFIFPEQ